MLLQSIKDRRDFLAIQDYCRDNDCQLKGKNIILLFKDNPQNSTADGAIARFGMVVSKRVSKKAVVRNRIKRLLRESFRRLLKEGYLSPCDYIAIAKYSSTPLKCKDIYEDLLKLLETK